MDSRAVNVSAREGATLPGCYKWESCPLNDAWCILGGLLDLVLFNYGTNRNRDSFIDDADGFHSRITWLLMLAGVY
jgi:hypothetical protein